METAALKYRTCFIQCKYGLGALVDFGVRHGKTIHPLCPDSIGPATIETAAFYRQIFTVFSVQNAAVAFPPLHLMTAGQTPQRYIVAFPDFQHRCTAVLRYKFDLPAFCGLQSEARNIRKHDALVVQQIFLVHIVATARNLLRSQHGEVVSARVQNDMGIRRNVLKQLGHSGHGDRIKTCFRIGSDLRRS